MRQYIKQSPQDLLRRQLLLHVKRQTIAWLIQNDGIITFQEQNTISSSSHVCQLYELDHQDLLQIISAVVVCCLHEPSPQIPNFTEHEFNPYEPDHCNNLVLSAKCQPKLTIHRTRLFNECMKHTQSTRQSIPSLSVRAIILSWMIDTSTVFQCNQAPQQFVNEFILCPCKAEETDCVQSIPYAIVPYMAQMSTLFTDFFGPTIDGPPQQEQQHAPTTPPKRPSSTLPTQCGNRKINSTPNHSYSTRSRSNIISMFLQSGSRSKKKIQYNSDKDRHMPGTAPKLKVIRPSDLEITVPPISPSVLDHRLHELSEIIMFHVELKYFGFLAPRDEWENWINNHANEPQADRSFMVLMTIIMSSSTSDVQLSNIMPRLFACGMISATAVSDIADKYGMNAMCSLISESGRYYANAERLVNAADYFKQRHHGVIPQDITIYELCTLIGIGYKTACLILEAGFGRVDGIPSDVHVIRWTTQLGWVPSNLDGLATSKHLEAWIPADKWHVINPLFGALGQHSSTIDLRTNLLSRLGKTEHLTEGTKTKIKTIINSYR